MNDATMSASAEAGEEGAVMASSLPLAPADDGMRAWAEALVDRRSQ